MAPAPRPCTCSRLTLQMQALVVCDSPQSLETRAGGRSTTRLTTAGGLRGARPPRLSNSPSPPNESPPKSNIQGACPSRHGCRQARLYVAILFVFSTPLLTPPRRTSFSSNPQSYTHIQPSERRTWPPFLSAVLEGKCQQRIRAFLDISQGYEKNGLINPLESHPLPTPTT